MPPFYMLPLRLPESLTDRYEVVEGGDVGWGRQGCIYTVRDLESQELLACKTRSYSRPCDQASTASYKEIIRREMVIHSRLHDERIVRFREYVDDVAAQRFILFMELCTQGTLSDLLKSYSDWLHPLPDAIVFKLFVQLVQAVQYLHTPLRRVEGGPGEYDQYGTIILHGDLTPQNIFVQSSGRLVIGDFGSATCLRAGQTTVAAEVRIPHSANYLSPEARIGLPYGVSSEMWSLGCILYECAAYKPAFPENDDGTPFGADYRPPLAPNCSAAVQLLITRLLSLNPDDRPLPAEILKMGELGWAARKIDQDKRDESLYDRVLEVMRREKAVTEKEKSVGKRERAVGIIEVAQATKEAELNKALEALTMGNSRKRGASRHDLNPGDVKRARIQEDEPEEGVIMGVIHTLGWMLVDL